MELEYLKSCNLCHSKRIENINKESNIYRCQSCGYIFNNPRPTIEELKSFYSKPTKYDSWLSKEHLRDLLWLRRYRKFKKFSKTGSLLDISAGIGQFLQYARSDFEIYGTEISESAIKIAQDMYNISLTKGEISEIEFSRSFDNITMFHVLEHLLNPRAAIEKCHSLLNKNGILVIAVPNDVFSWRLSILMLLRRIGFKGYGQSNGSRFPKITLDGSLEEIHLSHFTANVLVSLLNRIGFTVLDTSLDPYFAAGGLNLFFHFSYYYLHRLLSKIIPNYYAYDAIWIVAKKK